MQNYDAEFKLRHPYHLWLVVVIQPTSIAMKFPLESYLECASQISSFRYGTEIN